MPQTFIITHELAAYCLNAIKAYRLNGELGKAKRSIEAFKRARLRGVVEPFPI